MFKKCKKCKKIGHFNFCESVGDVPGKLPHNNEENVHSAYREAPLWLAEAYYGQALCAKMEKANSIHSSSSASCERRGIRGSRSIEA